MTLKEKILQGVQNLSEPLQAEVLDFVEYLESKVEDEKDWSTISLSFAMSGMEKEESSYILSDLKEIFS